MATGTLVSKDGKTTHRCRTCGKRFPGTQKRGRPYKSCAMCRVRLAQGRLEDVKAKALARAEAA